MNEFETASQRFAILDHAPMGQMVLRDDLVVVFWNRCLESWTGVSRAELLGKSILDRYTPTWVILNIPAGEPVY